MIEHNSGFFGAPEKDSNKQAKNHLFINVGGEQFLAVAVALIDYLQNNPKSDALTLKKILGSLYQYFPNYIVKEPYLTPADHIKTLLNTSRKSELIESIAYILRQLTVDELYTNPLNLRYRSVFEGLITTTPKTYLRSTQTQLPATALNALEHALNIPITLLYKDSEKELGLREGALNNTGAALTIQVIGKNYYPRVKHKTNFSHIGQVALTIKPAQIPVEQEGFMADILDALTQDNQRLLDLYEHLRNTLLSMHTADELRYEQLVNIYIALLPYQTNNASFLLQLEKAIYPMTARALGSSEQGITKLLANTLASWVVSGAIKQEQLFEQIENNQYSNPGISKS